MPASKRSSFSLLNPVQPLPDEEPAPAAEPAQAERAAVPASSPAPARATLSPSPAKAPPGTIRLNDAAGASLWAAFAEAKAADPFLSYRQFASDIVTSGLRAHARKAR